MIVGMLSITSQVRTYQHNNGFVPNVAEKNYWAEYKTVAEIT